MNPTVSMVEAVAYLGGEERPYPVHAVRPEPRRVLEIGSGVGNGTIQAAMAWPEATFTCLEPDDTARATLAWRLAAHGLRDRVSVLPLRLEDTDFLGTFDLLLVQHVMCVLTPEERSPFLIAMTRRMGYDGVAVMDDHFGPSDNLAIPRTQVGNERFGEFSYSQFFTADPAGPGKRNVVHEFVITDRRGDEIHHARHEAVDHVVDDDLALSLIRAAGLVPDAIDDGWLRLSTP